MALTERMSMKIRNNAVPYVLLILLFLGMGPVLGYDGENNFLMFDVGNFLVGGGFGMKYEHKLSDDYSFAIPLYSYYNENSRKEIVLGQIGIEMRSYFSDRMRACHGAFVLGSATMVSGDYTEEDSGGTVIAEEDISGVTLEVGVGYKGIWDNGFSQEISAGIEYGSIKSSGDYYEEDIYNKSRLNICWTIGFTW